MMMSAKDAGKKLKSVGREALKGTGYFCHKSRKRERSWQGGCEERSRGSSFGQEKKQEKASRPVRCFLGPAWER